MRLLDSYFNVKKHETLGESLREDIEEIYFVFVLGKCLFIIAGHENVDQK